jgi:acetylornithine deacetylase/succinyl-diaminopimelate desuccinylase-like protein
MAAIVAELEELAATYQSRAPHPLLGCPTLSVATIAGGTITPMVPDRCSITIDRRMLPGEDGEAVQAEVADLIARTRTRRRGLDATVQLLSLFSPSEIAADEAIVSALQEATGAILGAVPAPIGLAGTTDANLMIDPGGIPTVIFGPGDLALCHKPDEYLAISELVAACKIYVVTILALLGPRDAAV